MTVTEMLFAGFVSIRQRIFKNAGKGEATPEIFDLLMKLREAIIAAHGFEFDMDALPLMFEGWLGLDGCNSVLLSRIRPEVRGWGV